jgi:hypothetical protein
MQPPHNKDVVISTFFFFSFVTHLFHLISSFLVPGTDVILRTHSLRHFSPPDFTNQLTVYSYVPYTEENSDITACGIPIDYNASTEWANKKVVLFAVPGTCQLPAATVKLLTSTWVLSHLAALRATYPATLRI